MVAQPRILVVDDEPRGVELMRRVLRPLGEILCATSAAEARCLFDETELDVVVTDQRMPGASGVDLLAEIGEKNDSIGRILITGYADLEATIDAINRGRIHGYLSKPCPPSQLRLTVESVLERVQLVRQNGELLRKLVERNRKLMHATRLLRESQRTAEAAVRAKSAFLAHVGEELRSPIHTILGYARSLEHGDLLHEDRLATAEAIARNGNDLIDLINDILEVARADSGDLEVDPVEFSLVDLFTEVSARTRPYAEQAGLSLSFEVEEDLGPIVSDPLRLRQILCHLLENSLRHTRAGSVEVHAGAFAEREDALWLRVRDTGSGMDPASVPRALQPFRQLEDGTPGAGRTRGVGLGLTLCKRLVELLEGKLDIQTSRGEGTCVTIELPRVSRTGPCEPTDAPDGKGRDRAEHPLLDHRVVVLEDNVVSQRVLASLLCRAGARVELARDPAELVSLAEPGPLDASSVLIDRRAQVQGRLAAQRLREAGYAGAIVALQTPPFDAELPACFDAALTRPVDPLELIETLAQLGDQIQG